MPADIKLKSIKEAQHEIKEIITNLENVDSNLEESIDKYNRMMQLNNYIQEEFKKQLKQIKELSFKNKKNSTKN